MIKLTQFVVFMGLGVHMLSFIANDETLQTPWKAPASANELVNPYLIEPLTLPQGQEIYTIYCASCHGNQGKGDGIAVKNLKIKPIPVQNAQFTTQTNGALFWKISEGRGKMPSFKELLSDEQKWQLVEYMRDISKPFDQQMNPLKDLN